MMIPTSHRERLLSIDVFMYSDEIKSFSKDEIIECIKKMVDPKERPINKSVFNLVVEKAKKRKVTK